MEAIREYLLNITAASVICAIAMRLVGNGGAPAKLSKLICGIFILITVIRPVSTWQMSGNGMALTEIFHEAESVAAAGENSTRESLSAIIKQQVETYILDKATQFNAQLQVTVTMSGETIPMPIAVTLRGTVSPYAKKQLQSILSEELGIQKEDQQWISQ